VNWLRASARFQRWDEELVLLGHEMQWTVAFFKRKKDEWHRMALDSERRGLASYAYKQVAFWEGFEIQAERMFANARKEGLDN
jgi:hypothetical protein